MRFEWSGKFNGINSFGKILTAHLTKTKKKKPKKYLSRAAIDKYLRRLIMSVEWRGKFNGIILFDRILKERHKEKETEKYLHERLEIHLSPHFIH